MLDKEALLLRYELSSVFSPASPVNQYVLFAGRGSQVDEMFRAVGRSGEHVILYGERGVGKTSLANVLSEVLSGLGMNKVTAIKINCDVKENFSSLWQRVFRELTVPNKKVPAGFKPPKNRERTPVSDFTTEKLSPDDVRYFLQQLPGATIVIIDELDRIEDRKTITSLLADTIKSLSDHGVLTTIVLIGVADSVDEIITDHKSIERALVQIHMPLMSMAELGEILDKGLGRVNMTIDEEATKHIAALSQGLPHYTHLLGLLAAEFAVDSDRNNVTMGDVYEAARRAAKKTSHSNVQCYLKATGSSHKDSLYEYVLLACAFTKTDDLGYFSTPDVRNPLSKIMGRRYEIPAFARHLNDFCDPKRGAILKRVGTPRRFRYRFTDPQMRPFVTMTGLAKDLITESIWRELSGKKN